MKEISVVSPLGQFATVRLPDDKVDAYIQKHSQAGTWGKPERWTTEPIKGAETRVNEFGETEYLAPAEFTVTITDITEQIAEQEQKESLRSQRKQAALDAINKTTRGTTIKELREEIDALKAAFRELLNE